MKRRCVGRFIVIIASVMGMGTTMEATNRVSVHDPSILYDNGMYYVFGTHVSYAQSTDLEHWVQLNKKEYENPSPLLGNLNVNLKSMFEWAGYDDADTKYKNYAIWAPDVIWNPQYKWEDGSRGAYMYYFSTSSTWRRSAIGFAVSKTVLGPYEFKDVLVYSGFTKESSTDGSLKDTHYRGTHIEELIEGGILKDGFNAKWNSGNGQVYNTNYAPNAIDAHVFLDAKDNMHLVYGSWSGGIFLLSLDETTGRVEYPGKNGTTPHGEYIDQYFGTHLLGGWHQSGEGPYIVYDEHTKYYYLFVTYGELKREGGYNMRMFRSKEVSGPYVDALGQHPVYTKKTTATLNDQFGVKLMGNYQFDALETAYMSPGHNSVWIDEQNNWFLIYHTRFDEDERHELRVHRMVMNEDGWPLPLPFEYHVKDEVYEQIQIDEKEMVGEYEFVCHGTDTSGMPIEKERLLLESDGKVSGALQGIWRVSSLPNATPSFYIQTEQGREYVGNIAIQTDESDEQKPVLVFTAMGNNEMIWGSKLYTSLPQKKITLQFKNENGEKLIEDHVYQLPFGNLLYAREHAINIAGYELKSVSVEEQTVIEDTMVEYEYALQREGSFKKRNIDDLAFDERKKWSMSAYLTNGIGSVGLGLLFCKKRKG